MSDTWVAPGWWLASDGKWYPPAGEAEHAAAVDTVLAHRAADQPLVLDLRASEPVIEHHEPADLTPPPVPSAAVAAPSVAPTRATAPASSSGGRWGGHRRVATPIGSTPTV